VIQFVNVKEISMKRIFASLSLVFVLAATLFAQPVLVSKGDCSAACCSAACAGTSTGGCCQGQ
jgi:hypothetical protein